ncbi:permease-like cell division protein FtsX [Nocardioides litoris]|uniref:permease-like cell division protein FtsX n=1 Tax=Nocardioides litoris TaxID=1926648 RepID=UPI00111F9D49|nr:permease-like cell division protein FtsX [Nocardioides litoris]
MQLRHVSTNLRQSLRRNVSMHAAVIITLFVSLSLAGIGVLLSKQAALTTDVIGSELQITVTLCVPDEPDFPQCTSEVTPEQEATVLQTIRDNPEVAGTEVISKEQGLDNLRERGVIPDEQFEGSDPLITADVIPKAIRVTLKDPQDYDGVTSAVQDLDGVREITTAQELVGPVFEIIDYTRYAAWGAAGALVLAAVMLVANTIRLTALARRKEIEIMRLVGASRVFIVLPFLLEAVFTALVGVALAAGALAAFTRFAIIDGVAEVITGLPFIGWGDFLYTLAVIGILGPVLTVLPTLLLTRKYLRF